MLMKNFSKSMLIKMVCGLQRSCDGPASSIMSPLAPKSGKLLISPNNTTPLLIVRQILLRSNIGNVQRTLWGNCKLKLHVQGKGLIICKSCFVLLRLSLMSFLTNTQKI